MTAAVAAAVRTTTHHVSGWWQGMSCGGACTTTTGAGGGGAAGGAGGGGVMLDPHRTHVTATGVLSSAHTGHASVADSADPDAPGARQRASSVSSSDSGADEGRAQNSG